MKLLGPILVLFLRLFNFVCRALPSQRALYRAGRLLGGVTFILQRKRRAIALRNLELVFGTELSADERKRIARASFDSVAATYFEMFWQPEKHGIRFEEWAPIEGLEHLRAAHDQGKGVIIACPHLGNWAVLGRSFAQVGYRFAGLMRPSAIPAIRAHFATELEQVNLSAINTPLPPGGFSNLMEILADGTALMMVADRRSNDYLIDFLGHPAWTAHGTATMHLRSGAPIVTAYAIREENCHRLIFEPAIVHTPTDDKEADTTAILTEINNRFSAMIRQHPEQWLWLHERWRGRRKGENPSPDTKTNKELDAVDE